MKITCVRCTESFRNYTTWLDHLGSKGHLDRSRETCGEWSQEANERSVVIEKWAPMHRNLLDTLHYFAEYGMLSDFMVTTVNEPKCFTVVQFDSIDSLEALYTVKVHSIDGKQLDIRTKSKHKDLSAKESNSMPKNFKITCEPCQGNFRNYATWLNHLGSKGHLDKSRETCGKWSREANERSVVFENWAPLDRNLLHTLYYFAKYGMLSDFVVNIVNEPKCFTVVQFDDKDSIGALNADKVHIIDGKRLGYIRPKSCYLPKDWILLEGPDSSVEHDPFLRRHHEMLKSTRDLSLEAQLQALICQITLSEEDMELRKKVLKDLLNVLRRDFRRVQIHPFGSFITLLADKGSDLDIFVDAYADLHGPREVKKKIIYSKMNHAFRSFQKNGIFEFISAIKHARVPIIKILHRPTGTPIDLSFENMTSVRNSELIQFLTSLDPRVTPLLLLIRYWGKFYHLTGSFSIKNYALILLVFVFLAKKSIIPSIYTLQNWSPDPPAPMFINGWNCSFYDNHEEVTKYMSSRRPPIEADESGRPTCRSILKLALEFFEMYFNLSDSPKTMAVCPFIGDFLVKSSFWAGFEDELPPQYAHYLSQVGEEQPRLKADCRVPMCVQDPFVLNYNVSAGTRENLYVRFSLLCSMAVVRIRELLATENFRLLDLFEPNNLPGLDDIPKRDRARRLNEELDMLRDAHQEIGAF